MFDLKNEEAFLSDLFGSHQRAVEAIAHFAKNANTSLEYATHTLFCRAQGWGEFCNEIDGKLAELFPELANAHSLARKEPGFVMKSDLSPLEFDEQQAHVEELPVGQREITEDTELTTEELAMIEQYNITELQVKDEVRKAGASSLETIIGEIVSQRKENEAGNLNPEPEVPSHAGDDEGKMPKVPAEPTGETQTPAPTTDENASLPSVPSATT